MTEANKPTPTPRKKATPKTAPKDSTVKPEQPTKEAKKPAGAVPAVKKTAPVSKTSPVKKTTPAATGGEPKPARKPRATTKKVSVPKTTPETAKEIKETKKATNRQITESVNNLKKTLNTPTRRTKTPPTPQPEPEPQPHENAVYFHNGVASFVKYSRYPMLITKFAKLQPKLKTREYLTTFSLLAGLISVIVSVPILTIGTFFQNGNTVGAGIVGIVLATFLIIAVPYYFTIETTKELTAERHALLKSLSHYAHEHHNIRVDGVDIINALVENKIMSAYSTITKELVHYTVHENTTGITFNRVII